MEEVKLNMLMMGIDNLSANPSVIDKQRVRELIIDLKHDLQGLYCLVLRDLLIVMENHLNDVEKLLTLNTNLENIRRAKTVWELLRKVCTVVDDVLALGVLALGEPNKDVQSQATMVTTKINFVLVGKTGFGLSATGNKLLGKPVFRQYGGVSSATNSVDFSCSTYGQYNLLVVDQPGLCNTEMKEIDDRTAAVNNLSTALELCGGNVDAFLLVYRFGCRFMREDKCIMRAVKQIMGAHFMEHVIVVVTGGDNYERCMEDDNCVMSFEEWCQKPSRCHELYDDCEGRVVLFNNNEKNENKKREQIEKLLQVTQDLTNRRGRYTSKDFQKARVQRERFVLELDVRENWRSLVEKIRLLAASVNNLTDQARFSELLSTRQLVQELKHEIKVKDDGDWFYADCQTLVDNLESDVEEIIAASWVQLLLRHFS